jgi:hypothetical protein
MALTGNFISFQPIIESVYRRTGYQKIDVNEAVEVIGETLRLIGVLPAFKDVTTSGLGGNPLPLTVTDFRVQLPTDYITLKAVRKINLVDSTDAEGNPIKRISSFSPMTHTTDLFFKSNAEMQKSLNPTPGIYSAFQNVLSYAITLVGTNGSMRISGVGNMDRTIMFNSTIQDTIDNFIALYNSDYDMIGVTLSRVNDQIIFTEKVAGNGLVKPDVYNLSGNLNGIVDIINSPIQPVLIEAPTYQFSSEYVHSYKVDGGFIYTNFETGFIEITYTAFVTDEHGFPMIPDDQRFIEAVRWSLIEHIDYKQYRTGTLSREIYEDTEQKRAFYIKSAISKASLPSDAEMNAIKDMLLRSIKDTKGPDSYFKYNNLPEQRYNHNG